MMKIIKLLPAHVLALIQLMLVTMALCTAPMASHAGIDLTNIPESQWQSMFPEPDRRAADCSPGRHWELVSGRARCVCDGDLGHTIVGNNYPDACTTLPVSYGGQTCIGYDLYNWYYPYGNQVLAQSNSPTCGAPTPPPPVGSGDTTASTDDGTELGHGQTAGDRDGEPGNPGNPSGDAPSGDAPNGDSSSNDSSSSDSSGDGGGDGGGD